MTIKAMHHVSVIVDDLEAAIAFFTTLGMTVEGRIPVEGAPPNTLGLRQIMFAVEDVDDTVGRLRANGAELVGEMVEYADRLCYVRGPAGIIIALAGELV